MAPLFDSKQKCRRALLAPIFEFFFSRQKKNLVWTGAWSRTREHSGCTHEDVTTLRHTCSNKAWKDHTQYTHKKEAGKKMSRLSLDILWVNKNRLNCFKRFLKICAVIVATTYFPLFCRVSSAQSHLTSGFGMGPGGSTTLSHHYNWTHLIPNQNGKIKDKNYGVAKRHKNFSIDLLCDSRCCEFHKK